MFSFLLSLLFLLFTGPKLLDELLVVLLHLCKALSKVVFVQGMREVTLVGSVPALAIICPFVARGYAMGVLEFGTPFSTLLTIFLLFLIGV